MDSKLVIEQMAGRWKIKHPDMRPLAIQAQQLAPFGTVWTWVPREQNTGGRPAGQPRDGRGRAGRGVRRHETGADAARTVRPARSTRRPTRWSRRAPGRATRNSDARLERPRSASRPRWCSCGTARRCTPRRRSSPGPVATTRASTTRAGSRPSGPRLRSRPMTAASTRSCRRRCSGPATPPRRSCEGARRSTSSIEDGFREAAFGEWDGCTLDRGRGALARRARRVARARSTSRRPVASRSPRCRSGSRRRCARPSTRTPARRSSWSATSTRSSSAVRYCLDAPLAVVNRMLLAPASLTTVSFYESGACSPPPVLRLALSLPG